MATPDDLASHQRALGDAHHKRMQAVALNLASTADAVAATLEKLATTRDGLAATRRPDAEACRQGARRARTIAAHERQEADRLRHLFGEHQ